MQDQETTRNIHLQLCCLFLHKDYSTRLCCDYTHELIDKDFDSERIHLMMHHAK